MKKVAYKGVAYKKNRVTATNTVHTRFYKFTICKKKKVMVTDGQKFMFQKKF